MEWEKLAAAELARLTKPFIAKKRATILALVDARLAGKPDDSVWNRPDTGSRNTYHAKWKRDPIFADVLAKIERMARDWNDGRSLRSLASAAERLALASPLAVRRAVEMLQSMDDTVVLRAAFGILDRAGMETAAKNATTHAVVTHTHDEWVADREARQQQAAAALADFDDE